jgi:hypothetical protein
MKTRFDRAEFGLTRFEVMNWNRTPEKGQPEKTRVVAMAAPPPARPVKNPFFNKRNPYFEVKLCDIEGFGDPYHEDMDLRNVIPAQVNILPKTELQAMAARITAWREAAKATETPAEYQKLTCQYIRAGIERRKQAELAASTPEE